MQIYRVETTILIDGKLTITGLPFRSGERVEVIVRSCKQEQQEQERYPLRGTPIRYTDPCESVAANDWEVLQ